MDEAQQGPGLLEQTVKYAGRSAIDAARGGVHEKSIAGRIGSAMGKEQDQEPPETISQIVERFGAPAPEQDAPEHALERPEVAMNREQSDGSLADWMGKEEPAAPDSASALVDRFGARETEERPPERDAPERRR